MRFAALEKKNNYCKMLAIDNKHLNATIFIDFVFCFLQHDYLIFCFVFSFPLA